MSTTVSSKRSLAKAVTYRIIIVCLDFLAVYLLTGQARTAVGFMVVSNVYTTVGYFLHERAWAHIAWGNRSTQSVEALRPTRAFVGDASGHRHNYEMG